MLTARGTAVLSPRPYPPFAQLADLGEICPTCRQYWNSAEGVAHSMVAYAFSGKHKSDGIATSPTDGVAVVTMPGKIYPGNRRCCRCWFTRAHTAMTPVALERLLGTHLPGSQKRHLITPGLRFASAEGRSELLA